MLRKGPVTRIDLDCGFPLMALLTKQAREELRLADNELVSALIKAPPHPSHLPPGLTCRLSAICVSSVLLLQLLDQESQARS